LNFFSLYKRKFLYEIKRKVNIDSDINLKLEKLNDFFIHYGTDKASHLPTDKNNKQSSSNKTHGYSEFYQKHLSHYKSKSINILEIGSYAGASAAAFAKYFSNSKIFCLDVNISNFKYSSKRIKVYGLDITNKKKLNNFFNNIGISENEKFFDVIIDDGSHKLSDILLSFKYLFKNLRNQGYYIIEDFKFPNFFDHLNDIDHIKVDEVIKNFMNQNLFDSTIISKDQQQFLHTINKTIYTYKGNLEHSDVAFIKKDV